DQRVVLARELARGRVAQLARPRLQVALARVRHAARALHLDRDAELLAQRAAVALVRVRLLAQDVVDVQRAHSHLAPQPDRHVERAHRIAPAREHYPQRALAREHAARADRLADRLGVAARAHALALPRGC